MPLPLIPILAVAAAAALGASKLFESDDPPQMFGKLSFQRTGNKVRIFAENIRNPGSSRTGTLWLMVWATAEPFRGGNISGRVFAKLRVGALQAKQTIGDVRGDANYLPLYAGGSLYTTITLVESADGESNLVLRDFMTFDGLSDFPADPSMHGLYPMYMLLASFIRVDGPPTQAEARHARGILAELPCDEEDLSVFERHVLPGSYTTSGDVALWAERAAEVFARLDASGGLIAAVLNALVELGDADQPMGAKEIDALQRAGEAMKSQRFLDGFRARHLEVRGYAVLELKPGATYEEVRASYRRLAAKHHPDRIPPGASPAERQRQTLRFQEIEEAYSVLKAKLA